MLGMLERGDPAAPRLTWYGDDGERVDLSGRVLRTWVVKAANLLANDCGAGPGTVVGIDLPAHWRLLVWGLGTWAVGAGLVLLARPADATVSTDVVISADPALWLDAPEVVAVPLAPLAMAWPGDLPAGALDGAAELMTQPDTPAFAPAASPEPLPEACIDDRTLLVAEHPAALLTAAWHRWAVGGSVVVATPRATEALEAIRRQERAG